MKSGSLNEIKLKDMTPTRLIIYVILCLSALLGNRYSIPFFFGVDFLFGSIFVFVILGYFGFLAAVPASIIASSYTYFLWGHPYAAVIFLAEFLIVGYFSRRFEKNMILLDLLFWLFIGIPLVYFFYSILLKLPLQSVVLIMLKQGINGTFNVFLAFIIIHFFPPLFSSDSKDFSKVSFRTMIFTIMLLSLSVPSLVIIVFLARTEFVKIREDIIQEVNSAILEADGGMKDWLSQRILAVNQAASKLNNQPMIPSPATQDCLKLLISVNQDFHNMYVADRNAMTTAFYPPVNEKGESTIGIDFSDREYFRLLKNGSELVISDVFEGRGGVFSPIVTISAPIYDRNQFNGFALAALKIDHINSIIKRIAGNRMGEITIIDSKYKVIASTVPGRDVLTLYRADSFWDLLEIENGLFQGFRKEDAQRAEMTKWNNSVFIKAIPTSINENWQIIVEIATRPFITQLNQFYISGLLFLFLLSIVSIILSIIVSTATVKSLLQLQRSSQDLSEHIEKGETVESWPKAEVARSSLEVAKLDPKGL